MNNSSNAAAFLAMLRRDLTLYLRHKSDVVNPLVFSLIVISLFPLAIGPEPGALAAVAPGLVWVVALLACMLSTDSLFKPDYEDGCLEQWMTSPQSAYLLVIAKLVAHWLSNGLPIALIAPILGLMLSLPAYVCIPLFTGLAVGTIILSGIGAVGAALTVGLKKSGVLVSLLVLPLYVPVLIFGVSLADAAVQRLSWLGYISIVAAMALIAVTLCPLAIVGALKLHLES